MTPSSPAMPTLVLRGIILLAFALTLLHQLGVLPTEAERAGWIGLIAPVFYLWAFWAGSAVFTRTTRKTEFGPALVDGLNQMGAGLMLGAWFAILGEPAFRHLTENGFTSLTGLQTELSLSNLVLAFTGLILVLLAQRGRQLRAQLDAIV
ncbi:hypothetical protein [Hyphobacterium sp.]|uniref:hypothetical protein n=1 Tax=Hyphobacterium sp. TaxID=2004662 RepID=UPI003BA8813D